MVQKITLHTAMQDYGQMIDAIILEVEGEIPELTARDFICSKCFGNIGASIPTAGVTEVSVHGKTVTAKTEPFLYRCDFSVSCKKLNVVITKENADETQLFHEEMFRPIVENGVHYRLYEPEAYGPRPLILFLHGGGGSGEDNLLQLTDTLGAIKLAERLPDMYVLAPQAPSGGVSMEAAFAKMHGNPFLVQLGEDTSNDKNDRGWNREYLGRVCDIIRKMIREGKVNPKRVYCIGMSMGGFGTIKTVSEAPDLFAACVPICPSMNGESYPILENFPDVPVYVASGYIDHQKSRHAYILRAIQKLWEKGRTDVKYTLFTEEELAAYGIGLDQTIPSKDIYAENHNSWILVLHNEYGILDWMLSHQKK